MRSFPRRQLGSTNWAFIITLLLLLVFIYMWYDETDKQDKMTKELADAKQLARNLNEETLKVSKILVDLSNVVGWKNKSYSYGPDVSSPERSFTHSDPAIIAKHVDPEGTVAGAEGAPASDGWLKQVIAESTLIFEREARDHGATTGKETEYNYETFSAEFKQQLKDTVDALEEAKSSLPTPPADPDDAAGQSQYESELADYHAKVAAYDAKLKALTENDAYKKYQQIIKAPGTPGDFTKAAVTVDMFQWQEGGERTLQAAIEGVPDMQRRMKQEIAALANKNNETIAQLRADKKAKEDAIQQLNTQLQSEQEGRTTDVQSLQTQLTDASARGQSASVRATTAENALAKVKDETGKQLREKEREIEARIEQNRLLKEKRDLMIARDDPDGTVLATNGALRTASIDVGSSDKAYVGQKFVVSSLDKAGNRVNRGEIMIVRITGSHSAQVRMLSGSVTAGDRIHNPFYDRGERIYVWFAGPMDKWPLQMAKERLAKLNVVVQDQMDGNTHYAIVPNSWAAAAEAAPAGEDEEDEGDGGAAAASSPLDETIKKARTFSANVITERLLDAFLDY